MNVDLIKNGFEPEAGSSHVKVNDETVNVVDSDISDIEVVAEYSGFNVLDYFKSEDDFSD
jgi:hypothetical protein